MRITQELLLKYAQETVKRRQRGEMDLHAAYLTGSVLSDSPLLGGSTDIDLVFVHKFQIRVARECERLTPEVSLDIHHKLREGYDEHKQLRVDPWMGYPLTKNHILLFDTDHWLEFIQAGVSANFHRPDNVLARVNTMFSAARDNWFDLMQSPPMTHHEWLHQYFDTLELAANAVAGLIGPPLTRRRFLIEYAQRLDNLGVPKVFAGFVGLLGFNPTQQDNLAEWTTVFESDLLSLAENESVPMNLKPCRHHYYTNAIRTLSASDSPEQALWPLLLTWLEVHLASSKPTPGVKIWESCLESLNLTEKAYSQKIEALDAYLDTLEVVIEAWADAYGM